MKISHYNQKEMLRTSSKIYITRQNPTVRTQWLTLPVATSSLWAAVAAFTKAPAAAVIDFAASNICSSKFSDSSAC